MLHNSQIKKFFCLFFCLMLVGCSDKPIRTLLQAKQGVVVTALSNDGRYGVVVSANHDTAMWDLTSNQYLYSLTHQEGLQANIIAATFNEKGDLLLTAEKTNIILWQTSTGKPIVNYNLPSQIQAIALSADGQKALIGLLNAKALYVDLNTGNPISSFSHTETINSVALSSDNKYALTGSDDHFAVLWDLKKTKAIHKIAHKKRVMHVAFSPDSKTFLTSGMLDKVRLWDVKSGEFHFSLGSRLFSVSSFRFSNDSAYIALGIFPGRIELWQLNKTLPILQKRFQIAKPSVWRPSATIVSSLAFKREGTELITQDSRGLAAWWLR